MTPGLSYYWAGGREQCEDNKWDEAKKKELNTHIVKWGRHSGAWPQDGEPRGLNVTPLYRW